MGSAKSTGCTILLAGSVQAAMDEMSVHQARLQIAAARERSAKLDTLQQLEEQRTEKEAALEVCTSPVCIALFAVLCRAA